MTILEHLRGHGVSFELLLHSPASTSARRAGCMRVPGGIVAKAVLIQTRARSLVAVLAATHSIDLDRLSTVLGLDRGEVRLATEDEAAAVFHDCEAGVVPAFGGLYGLMTIVDEDLATRPRVVFGTNSRHEAVWMRFPDYATLEAPLAARFARAPEPRGRTNHPGAGRRAG